MNIGYVTKAIYGGVAAFVGALATVVTGDETLNQVSLSQWLVAVVAGLTAAGAVFGVTNAPKKNAATK